MDRWYRRLMAAYQPSAFHRPIFERLKLVFGLGVVQLLGGIVFHTFYSIIALQSSQGDTVIGESVKGFLAFLLQHAPPLIQVMAAPRWQDLDSMEGAGTGAGREETADADAHNALSSIMLKSTSDSAAHSSSASHYQAIATEKLIKPKVTVDLKSSYHHSNAASASSAAPPLAAVACSSSSMTTSGKHEEEEHKSDAAAAAAAAPNPDDDHLADDFVNESLPGRWLRLFPRLMTWSLFLLSQLLLGMLALSDVCGHTFGYIGSTVFVSRWAAKLILFDSAMATVLRCTHLMHWLQASPFRLLLFTELDVAVHRFLGVMVAFYSAAHTVGHVFSILRLRHLRDAPAGSEDEATWNTLMQEGLPGLRSLMMASSFADYLVLMPVWTGLALLCCMASLTWSGFIKKVYRLSFKLLHTCMAPLMLVLCLMHGSGQVLDSWPILTVAFSAPAVLLCLLELYLWQRDWRRPEPVHASDFEISHETMRLRLRVRTADEHGRCLWKGQAGDYVNLRAPELGNIFTRTSHPFSICSLRKLPGVHHIVEITLFIHLTTPQGPSWTYDLRSHLQTYKEILAHDPTRSLPCPVELSNGIHAPASDAHLSYRGAADLLSNFAPTHQHVLLIGLGAGMTPMVALFRQLYGEPYVQTLSIELRFSRESLLKQTIEEKLLHELPAAPTHCQCCSQIGREVGSPVFSCPFVRSARACVTRRAADPKKPNTRPELSKELSSHPLPVYCFDSTRDRFHEFSLPSMVKCFAAHVQAMERRHRVRGSTGPARGKAYAKIHLCGADNTEEIEQEVRYIQRHCQMLFTDVELDIIIEKF